jgi:hypothetical protein
MDPPRVGVIMTTDEVQGHLVFLSHNKWNREIAEELGLHLQFCGARVWFDEWEMRAGDSVPGKLNEGLDAFTEFVLIWSEQASRSDWVRAELEAAISRSLDGTRARVIPLRLDATPLPALLSRLKWIDHRDAAGHNLADVAREILGMQRERDYRRAVQRFLDSQEIEVREFAGYGPMVGCPRCGAAADQLEAWGQTDYERDDQYVGARCRECGWQDGSEV